MKLRVEMLEDSAGRVRPYLVDVERDEVLPGQIACRLEAKLSGDQHSVIEVAFAIDDTDVSFAPSPQDESVSADVQSLQPAVVGV
jgi:hypothetical protein